MDVRSARLRLGALALLGTAGCSQMVLLGSECGRDDRACRGFADAETQHEAPFAAANGSPTSDEVGPAPGDASMDGVTDGAAPSFVPLDIQNPSFERNGGLDGDLLLSNLIAELVPVPPVDYVFAEIPFWFTCLPFAVLSVSTPVTMKDGGIAPMQFGDYLSLLASGVTVRQTLRAPLTVGAHYAFEAKVISKSEGENNLVIQVFGANDVCEPGTQLGRSAPIAAAADWTTVCVTFTASHPYTHLLLAPAYDGPGPTIPGRLMLDEFVQVPSCDPLH